MKKTVKRIGSVLLLFAMLCSMMAMASMPTAAAEEISYPKGAQPIPVTLDGKQILVGKAALIDGVTYVGLRGFCDALGVKVDWDAKTRTAMMTKGNRSATATDGDLYIFSEGRCYYSVQKIRIISNTMFVPVRAIAAAFGVEVSWNAQKRSVSLKNTGIMPKNGDSFYNPQDLYWLSRIISAEAKGESLIGQIAVGNVVLNRKESRAYPNTVYGVIFDRKNGVQFSPILNGSIYHTPTSSAVIAAKICLEGYSVDKNILFFMNPRIATNHWISQNRPYAFRIGNHVFYY